MENKGKSPPPAPNRLLLLLECLGLFVGIPALLYFWSSLPVLPLLWIIAGWCAYLLLKDPTFDRANLWRPAALRRYGKSMLRQFILCAVALTALVYLTTAHLSFPMAVQSPLFWLLLVLYPPLSVYPQELVYRVFFFHRYRTLFRGEWLPIAVNTLLFGLMHLIFHNGIAVSLTLAGGILFASAYQRSRSLLLVGIMHTLFGWLLFALGLGQYFYSGTISFVSPFPSP